MSLDDLRCDEPGCENKKPYKTKDSLRKHYRHMHDSKPPIPRSVRSAHAGVFRCPECGAEFGRPQGLGIHRRSVHGIEGSASATVAARNKRLREDGAAAGGQSRRSSSPKEPVGLHAVLQHLFPDGIPAKKIPAVLAWIEETRRLLR